MKPGDIGIMTEKGRGGDGRTETMKGWKGGVHLRLSFCSSFWLELTGPAQAHWCFPRWYLSNIRYQPHCQSGKNGAVICENSRARPQSHCSAGPENPFHLRPVISRKAESDILVSYMGAKCKFLCMPFKSRRSHNAMDCLSANIY